MLKVFENIPEIDPLAISEQQAVIDQLLRNNREVEFQRSHIDRMPLGDLAGTILNLVICQPDIHWLFHCRAENQEFSFDDEPIKTELAGIPLTEPVDLAFIKKSIKDGIESIQQTLTE